MERKLKLIQIGVGGWGYSWAGIAKESKYWDIVGYVDSRQENLRLTSEKYGMPENRCFSNLTTALNNVDCDAVLVVVPPEFHCEVTVEALKANKHVLVEKPIADTVPSALKMIETARICGKKLMVSQNYRFKKGPRTVKSILNRDIIGKPGYISVNFHKAPHFDSPFRLKMEEPLLKDMAIHHFDQMRYLLGQNPVSVYAETWNPDWSWFEGNAVAVVLVEFENGVKVHYHGSWVSQGWQTTWDGDWRIECSQGEIHWSNNEIIVIPITIFQSVFNPGMLEKNGSMVVDLLPMELEDRSYSLYEFYNAIINDRKPETEGEDNLFSMALTFAAIESAKSGLKVNISEFLKNKSISA